MDKKKQTLYVTAFDCTGKTTAVTRLNIEGYKAIEIDPINGYQYMNVLPTEEEVRLFSEQYDKDGRIHLMGKQYFVDRFKNTPLRKIDPKFPQNFVKDLWKIDGKYDVVIMPLSKDVEEILEDYGFQHLEILPDKDSMFEFVGRMYVNNRSDYEIDHMISEWKTITEKETYIGYGGPSAWTDVLRVRSNYIMDVIDSYLVNKIE